MEGRWQVAFYGEVPMSRMVRVLRLSSESWVVVRLAVEATGTLTRFRGYNNVPVYGFTVLEISI